MNKNKNKKLIIIAVAFICIIFSRINVSANTLKEVSAEPLAVTLVIDTSGSMATTDPQKLRETAANIFIDLLSPDDYLGIITFNTKEEVVLPMQQIQSSDNKANFKKILSQKINATGDTDYLLALNEASKQLSSVNKGNLRKVILFLTDGEPDPNNTKKNDPAFMNPYMDSLWKSVSNLALNKYAVYSVGFSKGVNPSILERISSSTQGTLKISDDSSELALSFFDILGNLKNSKGFLDKTFELKDSDSLDFDLDEYTSQATMVFTNPDGTPFDVTLSAPDGKSTKNLVTVNKSDKYNIVTVNQKDEKLIGKWQVNLKGNGNIRAGRISLLNLAVNPEPNSLHHNETRNFS
jgi:Mg-chelatase subunit ChlD